MMQHHLYSISLVSLQKFSFTYTSSITIMSENNFEFYALWDHNYKLYT
jgi:hypothetical protein